MYVCYEYVHTYIPAHTHATIIYVRTCTYITDLMNTYKVTYIHAYTRFHFLVKVCDPTNMI